MKAIIDMATITTAFDGCRADGGHRKMLTFHNISQHFREIDARLRRILVIVKSTRLGTFQKPSKAIKTFHPPQA
jgi:hypothetical protein